MTSEEDYLWGAKAIADAIGREVHATHHMLAKGDLPARKVGAKWVCSRQRLMRFLSGEPEPPKPARLPADPLSVLGG